MSDQDLWQRYCKYLRIYPEVGLSLDISRMRFDEAFLNKMAPSIEQAFKDMHALEAGEIANPDENRMVGHYWLRDPETSPDPKLAETIISTNEKMKAFAEKVHTGEVAPEKGGKFENVLLIGIGGSALGPQLTSDALTTEADRMSIYFCDNTDPDGIARTVAELGTGLEKTVCIVISKSGGTVETRNGMLELGEAYSSRGLSFAKHVVAITCPGSKLDQRAESEGWIDRFEMWDWVGGRTSIFSAVGLLPMALQGVNIDDFIAGGREMDEITRVPDAQKNPAALLALMWHFAGDGAGKKDMVVLPYKDRLMLFSKYLQQLVMESLGKEKDLKGEVVNQGIAVYGNKGSTDQHAYVQQLRDGVNNFFVTFVQVLNDFVPGASNPSNLEVEDGITSGDYLNGFLLGTRKALYESNRDSITIAIQELNTFTLGALIALYDRTVGLYASLVGINAYHQPGVEAGKKAAARVVDIQKALLGKLSADAEQSAEELASSIGASEDVETAYRILEHLAANPNRGVLRIGEQHPQSARYKLG